VRFEREGIEIAELEKLVDISELYFASAQSHVTAERTVHQTWKSRMLSSVHAGHIDQIIQRNPNWTFKFYDDHDMETFIETEFGGTDLAAFFRNLQNGQAKADIWRLAKLYQDGGLYLDIDSNVNEALEDIFDCSGEHLSFESNSVSSYLIKGIHPGDSFFLQNMKRVKEELGHDQVLVNWAMYFPAKHEFLYDCLNEFCEMAREYEGVRFQSPQQATVRLTGPMMVTRVFWRYLLANKTMNVSGTDFDNSLTFKIANLGNLGYSETRPLADLRHQVVLKG